ETWHLWYLSGFVCALAVCSWWWLLGEAIEQMAEVLVVPFYRISAQGPGRAAFPWRGPVVVVANHSAWLDPRFLGKVLPRRFIAMMTSTFFDLPGMRWLMKNVTHAIRVEVSTYRRDVPELRLAVDALDRGQVLLVFP